MDDATTIPEKDPEAAGRPTAPDPRADRTRAGRTGVGGSAVRRSGGPVSTAGVAGWVPTQQRSAQPGGQAGVERRRLPRARAVDRDDFLLGAAAGRTVTHVGFVPAGGDGLGLGGFGPGRPGGLGRDVRWLHARIATVARDLVGVDVDAAGVARARAAGYDGHTVDCGSPAEVARAAIRPAELVLVGEMIDQVDDVGAFLDGMRSLTTSAGTMIVTTPNVFRPHNLVATLAGRDTALPGQVSWHSWSTFANVLEKHRWRIVTLRPYTIDGAQARGGARWAMAAGRTAHLLAPWLANGLIAVCRQAPPAA